MALYRLPLLLALAFLNLARSATLHLSISPSSALLDPSILPASTHATLFSTGQRITAPLRRDGTLIFHGLEPGDYLLDIHSRDFVFPSLRVDVLDPSAAAQQEEEEKDHIAVFLTHPGNAWDKPGAKLAASKGKESVAVGVSAVGRRDFYQHRGGFDLLGFFKSPMILMGLVSLGLVFGMPYLMDNMDPEMKAEFEEMQKQSPLTGSQGAAQQIQNFDLAGWMAGKSDAPAASGAQKSGGGRR